MILRDCAFGMLASIAIASAAKSDASHAGQCFKKSFSLLLEYKICGTIHCSDKYLNAFGHRKVETSFGKH